MWTIFNNIEIMLLCIPPYITANTSFSSLVVITSSDARLYISTVTARGDYILASPILSAININEVS